LVQKSKVLKAPFLLVQQFLAEVKELESETDNRWSQFVLARGDFQPTKGAHKLLWIYKDIFCSHKMKNTTPMGDYGRSLFETASSVEVVAQHGMVFVICVEDGQEYIATARELY
jgi:hypothetical protein